MAAWKHAAVFFAHKINESALEAFSLMLSVWLILEGLF
jgi:hypothetical protein